MSYAILLEILFACRAVTTAPSIGTDTNRVSNLDCLDLFSHSDNLADNFVADD
jgi:hypothetical protein